MRAWTPASGYSSPPSPVSSQLSWDDGRDEDFQSHMDENGIIGLGEVHGEVRMLACYVGLGLSRLYLCNLRQVDVHSNTLICGTFPNFCNKVGSPQLDGVALYAVVLKMPTLISA